MWNLYNDNLFVTLKIYGDLCLIYSFTYHMEHTEFYCDVEITTGCHDNSPFPSYLTYVITKYEVQGSDTGHHRTCYAAFDDEAPGSPSLTIKMSGKK